MFKKELIKYLEKIPEDEHLFLLRAQDMFAADTIRSWIHHMFAYFVNRDRRLTHKQILKLADAELCAEFMWKYENKRVPD